MLLLAARNSHWSHPKGLIPLLRLANLTVWTETITGFYNSHENIGPNTPEGHRGHIPCSRNLVRPWKLTSTWVQELQRLPSTQKVWLLLLLWKKFPLIFLPLNHLFCGASPHADSGRIFYLFWIHNVDICPFFPPCGIQYGTWSPRWTQKPSGRVDTYNPSGHSADDVVHDLLNGPWVCQHSRSQDRSRQMAFRPCGPQDVLRGWVLWQPGSCIHCTQRAFLSYVPSYAALDKSAYETFCRKGGKLYPFLWLSAYSPCVSSNNCLFLFDSHSQECCNERVWSRREPFCNDG